MLQDYSSVQQQQQSDPCANEQLTLNLCEKDGTVSCSQYVDALVNCQYNHRLR